MYSSYPVTDPRIAKLDAYSHLFGIHTVATALKNEASIRTLLVLKDRMDPKIKEILKQAKQAGIEVRMEARHTLDTYGKSHQGIVALLDEAIEGSQLSLNLEELIEQSLNKNRLILALDGVTDPHNLGACIRSAEALGADGVVIPKDKAASVNAVVHKTSAGASQILPVVTLTNLSEGLKKLKVAGFWLVGLAGEAETRIQEIDFSSPTVIIMGSEGSGLRRLTKENCDFLAKIPMQGQTESLNVSVACGISLFEVIRQRAL